MRVLAITRGNTAPMPTTMGTPDPTTGAVSGALMDPDGDPLTVAVTGTPANGTVTVAATGTYTYTPTQAAREQAAQTPGPDSDSFTVTASDSQATTNVTVTVPISAKAAIHPQLTESITPISVGSSPAGVVVSGNYAYVTNSASNNVSVIDTNTNTVIKTISVGTAPKSLVATPDGSRVYVANSGTYNVSGTPTSSATRHP